MMKLYVGNLAFSTNENELREMFESHGDVHSASIVMDRDTGRSRGFGFVEMEREGGEKAIAEMNGASIGGRAIVVNEARPREERSNRGGGGGGGYRGGGGGGGGRGGRGGGW